MTRQRIGSVMGHALDDKHEITFGKHAGAKLGDIPASYLLFIADSDGTRETVGIFGYVLKNRDRLEKEAEEAKREYIKNKK